MTETKSIKKIAEIVASRCMDAYSAERYNSWSAVAEALLRRGFDEDETECIMRSKLTRWAADMSPNPDKATSKDVLAYIDKHGVDAGMRNYKDELATRPLDKPVAGCIAFFPDVEYPYVASAEVVEAFFDNTVRGGWRIVLKGHGEVLMDYRQDINFGHAAGTQNIERSHMVFMEMKEGLKIQDKLLDQKKDHQVRVNDLSVGAQSTALSIAPFMTQVNYDRYHLKGSLRLKH